MSLDRDLREVAFGVQEGQSMSGWFADWVSGVATPDGAETFAALRHRAVAATNRAIGQPPAVLVVAHGAMFRVAARGDGHRAEHADAERGADLLRTAAAGRHRLVAAPGGVASEPKHAGCGMRTV